MIPTSIDMAAQEVAHERLFDGNKRYRKSQISPLKGGSSPDPTRQPKAIRCHFKLCRLTRPAGIDFNSRMGDLFVIRVAGDVIEDAVIASVEIAVTVLDAPLVMLLGHTQCSAVEATISDATPQAMSGSIIRAHPHTWSR